MSWAARKRAKYIGGTLLVVFLVLVWIGFSVWYESPTCFDEKQNGDEDGVDCGGSCERICSFQAVDPVILWSRFIETVPGVYSAVALIENPNVNSEAKNVSYTFKLRDTENVLVYERKGTDNIPAQQLLSIFEPNMIVGDRKPARIFFEFSGGFDWKRAAEGEAVDLRIKNSRLENEDTEPRLTALLTNNDLNDVNDVEVVAILLAADGNAIGASNTIVPFIEGSGEANLIFTWPKPFAEEVTEILILPKVN